MAANAYSYTDFLEPLCDSWATVCPHKMMDLTLTPYTPKRIPRILVSHLDGGWLSPIYPNGFTKALPSWNLIQAVRLILVEALQMRHIDVPPRYTILSPSSHPGVGKKPS